MMIVIMVVFSLCLIAFCKMVCCATKGDPNVQDEEIKHAEQQLP